MKVLWLCLLLIDIGASPKILDNISVIISMKRYDTETSSRTSLWYSERLCEIDN